MRYIDEAGLQAGDKLPGEHAFARMTGVSLVTVRRAFAELASTGMVRREQGRGTFLEDGRIETETTVPGGLRRTIHGVESSMVTELLSISGREATRTEAKYLRLSSASSIWEIVRLRRLQGVVAVFETAVVPQILAPHLPEHFRESTQSLYEVLATEYKLAEETEEQLLLARPASALECRLMHLEEQEWVIEIAGTSYSANQVAFDRFSLILRADIFRFRLRTATSGTNLLLEAEGNTPSETYP